VILLAVTPDALGPGLDVVPLPVTNTAPLIVLPSSWIPPTSWDSVTAPEMWLPTQLGKSTHGDRPHDLSDHELATGVRGGSGSQRLTLCLNAT
jgi:hypothetical protein